MNASFNLPAPHSPVHITSFVWRTHICFAGGGPYAAACGGLIGSGQPGLGSTRLAGAPAMCVHLLFFFQGWLAAGWLGSTGAPVVCCGHVTVRSNICRSSGHLCMHPPSRSDTFVRGHITHARAADSLFYLAFARRPFTNTGFTCVTLPATCASVLQV